MNNSNKANEACYFENSESIRLRCNCGNKEWLSTEEAAKFLGWSIKTLRNKTSDGKVPYAKLGRLNRYSREELLTLILPNRRGPTRGNY